MKKHFLEVLMGCLLLICFYYLSREAAAVAGQMDYSRPVIVVDSGHGGDDPGKVGVNGTKEKDVNLAISKCLKEVLEDNGFDVVMTRNKDEILNEGGKFSKVGDLNKRCSIINNTYQINSNSIMISIHQNSFTNPNVKGAQSFFYEKS